MIAPLDETCTSTTITVEDIKTPVALVDDSVGQQVSTNNQTSLKVDDDFEDEDCPGAHTGNGCV